jgi:hypothetical protein
LNTFDTCHTLIWLAVYVYMAYSLQTIAKKTSTADHWLAWIPMANLYLMCKIAARPVWWLLLFFVPLVNLVITVIVWADIAKTRNKEGWLGLLMPVPLVNLAVMGYIAYSD